MTEYLDKVRDFQIAFDQIVNNTPAHLSIDESNLRFDLAQEELGEYFVATEDNDIVEILDSLVDQAYILFGTINAHGLQDHFIKAFELVHDNNMTKLDENGKVVKNSAGKVIKPSNYVPVDLRQLFE